MGSLSVGAGPLVYRRSDRRPCIFPGGREIYNSDRKVELNFMTTSDQGWAQRELKHVEREIESWPQWMRDAAKPQISNEEGKGLPPSGEEQGEKERSITIEEDGVYEIRYETRLNMHKETGEENAHTRGREGN